MDTTARLSFTAVCVIITALVPAVSQTVSKEPLFLTGDTVDITYSVTTVSATLDEADQHQHIRLIVVESSPTTARGRLLVTGSPPGTVSVINFREGTVTQLEQDRAAEPEVVEYTVTIDNRSGTFDTIRTDQVPQFFRDFHARNPNPPSDSALQTTASSQMNDTWSQIIRHFPEPGRFRNGEPVVEMDTLSTKLVRYTAEGDHQVVESRSLKETTWTKETSSGIEGRTSKLHAVIKRMNLQRDTVYSVSEQVLIVDDDDPLPIPLVNQVQGQGANGSIMRIERIRRKRTK